MAEIAVINKENQDYDIRDKKLVDASTASTVASGDAITLKTTAGTYVEIDRNSFVSAIRDILGASIASNTGGTSDVNTLPALTSSGALKSISTSDIASVLGVEVLENKGIKIIKRINPGTMTIDTVNDDMAFLMVGERRQAYDTFYTTEVIGSMYAYAGTAYGANGTKLSNDPNWPGVYYKVNNTLSSASFVIPFHYCFMIFVTHRGFTNVTWSDSTSTAGFTRLC